MVDLIDISHHQNITRWSDVPTVPIVHKVNEGTFVDPRFKTRMPRIAERTEIFGGYTVLIASKSSIAEQLEHYATLMAPFWRDGAFTQLDVEPWHQYSRPVSADEVLEALTIHDMLFGPDRVCIYINRNQEGMRPVYDQLLSSGEMESRGHWMPDYRDHSGDSGRGHRAAEAAGAIIHQYTSQYAAPGFTGGVDANKVLDWDHVNRIARTSSATKPPTPTEPEYPIPAPTKQPEVLWRDTRFHEVWLLGIGGAERITPKQFAWHRDRGVALIEEVDDAAVNAYVKQSGMRLEDLTPIH